MLNDPSYYGKPYASCLFLGQVSSIIIAEFRLLTAWDTKSGKLFNTLEINAYYCPECP